MLNDAIDLINRKQAKADMLEHQLETLCMAYKYAKYEAIKEFAERLKENAVTHNCRYEGNVYDIKAVTTYDIDRFLLEMEESNNASIQK